MIDEETLKAVIANEQYVVVGKLTTVCVITLKNGFEVIGTSVCCDPNDNDAQSEPDARKRAIERLIELETYVQQKKVKHE